MIRTLTRLYHAKGIPVLDAAVEKGWITAEERAEIAAS